MMGWDRLRVQAAALDQLVVLALCCSLLCACVGQAVQAERAQVDAYDHKRCTDYGFKPLDPEYSQCRYALAQMRYPSDPQAALAQITLDNLARHSLNQRRLENE